jgi:phosphatidylserine decarboxylase
MQRISEDRGRHMDSPASRPDIKRFLKLYGNQVAVGDIADPLDSFENFNQFFYRKLKPGARPIAHVANHSILTSAADCRLMAFNSLEEAAQFWVKVRGLACGVGQSDRPRRCGRTSNVSI